MGVTSAEVHKLESYALRVFIEENTNYYLHVSASKFRSTGSAAVEELAIRREIEWHNKSTTNTPQLCSEMVARAE